MLRWKLHLNNGVGIPRDSVKVAVGHKVYSFGVHGMNKTIDVRIFNTVTMRWAPLPLVTAGNECIEVEHQETFYRNSPPVLIENIIYHLWWVIYTFNVDTHTWFRPIVSGAGPDPAKYFAYTICAVRDSIYTCPKKWGYNVDVYKLATTTMTWSLIKASVDHVVLPGLRPAVVIGKKIFTFLDFAETWPTITRTYLSMFDTEAESWLSVPSPEGCLRKGCQAFAHNGQLYIFGYTREGSVDYFPKGMWRFNPDTLSWKEVEPGGNVPRFTCRSYRGSCCVSGDRFLLFFDGDDLFVLDLNPSLKTLCKLAVIHYGVNQAELTHNIRRELETMGTNSVVVETT